MFENSKLTFELKLRNSTLYFWGEGDVQHAVNLYSTPYMFDKNELGFQQNEVNFNFFGKLP